MARTLRVLLGISGGIAAYKAVEIVRHLRRNGHQVRCVLSRRATAFVAPLSLEVLSEQPVYGEDYLKATGVGEERHITAAQWADLLCIAPATANSLAGLALGLADDFLGTTALAFEGPLVVAPAMHAAMWNKEIVQHHVATLMARGTVIVGPVHGELASGEVGVGRMAEPAAIVAAAESIFGGGDLAGRTVVITAGPTRETIDPVRYLSNRSSGKMGFAMAAAVVQQGARTILIAGPVSQPTPRGVERVDVITAEEMNRAVGVWAPQADMLIMAAAVSDYRPRSAATTKLKRNDGVPDLDLERSPDVLATAVDCAGSALVVGFAAETGDLEDEGARKMIDKRVDFLVANDVSRADVGFDSDYNEALLFRPGHQPVSFSRRSKQRLATDLIDLFAGALKDRDNADIAARR